MDRELVLSKLRDAYLAHDVKLMKRRLAMGSFLLTDEDKLKVQGAIDKLVKMNAKPIHPLLIEAQKILGGKIIQDE